MTASDSKDYSTVSVSVTVLTVPVAIVLARGYLRPSHSLSVSVCAVPLLDCMSAAAEWVP